jgi:hypothetical protein
MKKFVSWLDKPNTHENKEIKLKTTKKYMLEKLEELRTIKEKK